MRKGLYALTAIVLWLSAAGFAADGREEMRRVPVVMYHSVCKTNVGEFVISPDSLREDFAYLKRNGYESVFVRDIIGFCEGKNDLPSKPVVLTFDDGFYNNLYYAEKIAAEYDMKIVLSLVGSYMEREAGEKKRSPVYSYLKADEAAGMYARGRVEFCNHTYDLHRITSTRKGLRKKKDESAQDYEKLIAADSERCRALVQKSCGCRMNVFTYPFGCYSAETNGILKKLGYRAVLTCKGGINTFYKGSDEGLDGILRYNRSGTLSTRRFFDRIGV